MTLTNVLIAGNTAGSGGGIYCGNWIANTGTNPGQGIHIWMNNVTIAKNTATSGAGMYLADNLSGMNLITVKANNSIIWGGAAAYNGGVTNIIRNDLKSRITLKNSLAWADGSLYDGGSNKTASSFTGTYGPFAGADNYAIGSGDGTNDLVDVGNSDYPDSVDDLLPATALDGLSRSGDFNTLITTHVINPGWLNKDVTAALGDRLHTTNPGILGEAYSVSVSDTPPSTAGADKNRAQGGIDVGAYEVEKTP
jgi:predicted outer membrane repeat protein